MVTPSRRRGLRPVGDGDTPPADVIGRLLPGPPEPEPGAAPPPEPSGETDAGAVADEPGKPDPAGEHGEARRAAIIPAPFQSGQRLQTARDFAELNAYRAGFHGIRLPFVYLPGSLVYAGRGAARLAGRYGTWMDVTNLRVLESQALARGDAGHAQVMHAHTERERTKKRRRQLSAAGAVAAVPPSMLLAFAAPWEAQAAAAAVAFTALVHHGRPKGKPLIPPAILPPAYQVPTPEIITKAFGSLGIPAINKYIEKNKTLDWVSDVHRDGPGWAVELDLPEGVKAETIVAKRKELSSGLRRPLSAVWPEGVPGEHEGRVFLWIGRQDMAKMKPPPWPLLKTGTADYFQPAPFAFTPRAVTVHEKLFGKNWLIGAAPGNGKTAALRVLASWAALDPTVELWVHELLGKGDLDPFTQVAHRYCSGLDRESLEYAAQSLAMLWKEVERRTEILKKIPITERPDGDITREIAAKYGLTPIVAIFDEIHNLFLHPEFGSSATANITNVIRSARALGITVIAATQRPDKDSMPTTMSGIVTTRFCLKVPDWQSNNMILGTGAHDAGWSAVAFRQETDAGLGWLRGTGDPRPVKTYYLNLPATQKICARARAAREAAGTLSGYALGLDDGDQPRNLLQDVLSLYGPKEKHLYWETVAKRLAERYPAYAAITPDAASSQVREAAGMDDSDQGREPGGPNRKGVKKTTIEPAATVTAAVSMAGAPAKADPLDVELLVTAAEMVITEQWATVQTLHRKLRVGMDDARDLMAALEWHQVVSEPDENGNRDVLDAPARLTEVVTRIREAEREPA
jgi:S-DNA-T family DNA segregation ATPase FtsK/SpoIIIE